MDTSSPLAVIDSPQRSAKTVASTGHTVFLLFVLAGWAVWGYLGAQHARAGSTPHRAATYVLTCAWEWLVVGYIAWGARKHGSSLGEIIGPRWKSFVNFLTDWGISIAFWFVAITILAITAQLLHMTKNLENTKFLLPQSSLEVFLWILTSITAGICEEIIFRGYFQKQFLAWTSNAPAAILLSAIAFGGGHVYQSGKAAVVITVYGILFGVLVHYRKNLRPAMMAHAWHDTISGLAFKLIDVLKRAQNIG